MNTTKTIKEYIADNIVMILTATLFIGGAMVKGDHIETKVSEIESRQRRKIDFFNEEIKALRKEIQGLDDRVDEAERCK